MQLLDSLFEIVEMKDEGMGFSTTIKFFSDHVIFSGHFPGQPVTPGVIFLGIVHELLERHLGKTIRLVELSTCKFLRIVNPEIDGVAVISVTLSRGNELIRVKALGKNESGTVFKLHAEYCTYLK